MTTNPSRLIASISVRWTRLSTATLLAVALFAPPAPALQNGAVRSAAPLSAAEREAAERIDANRLRETVAELAAPEMQGRGTGQPGGEKAAAYLADRFTRLGLKPLGDNHTYLQAVKFKVYQPLPESTMEIGHDSAKFGEDFVVAPPFTGDRNVSAPVVFLSHGLKPDFDAIQFQGRYVLLINGPPKAIDENYWQKQKAERIILTRIFQLGAAGIIVAGGGAIDFPFSIKVPYGMIASYMTRRLLVPEDRPEPPSAFPPIVFVNDATAEKLFAGSGTTYAEARAKADVGQFVAQSLKTSMKLTLRIKKEKVTGSNVVGLLEGSDAKLKDEAIAYSAHYDAFGAEPDGRIYPGAADNAIGVAQVLSVAEAFAAAHPRRSIIFIGLTGEEYGSLGAEYWTKHATWKLERLAANLNFDGIGTEVYGPVTRVVGFGAEHSELGGLLEQVAAAMNRTVAADPMPEEKTFYRSDHYAFVKRGIPALMLMGLPDMDNAALVARIRRWEQTDYHQPGDAIRPEWNWEGPRAIAAINLIVGMRLAALDTMPSWLPSSPFRQSRGTNKEPPPEQ